MGMFIIKAAPVRYVLFVKRKTNPLMISCHSLQHPQEGLFSRKELQALKRLQYLQKRK